MICIIIICLPLSISSQKLTVSVSCNIDSNSSRSCNTAAVEALLDAIVLRVLDLESPDDMPFLLFSIFCTNFFCDDSILLTITVYDMRAFWDVAMKWKLLPLSPWYDVICREGGGLCVISLSNEIEYKEWDWFQSNGTMGTKNWAVETTNCYLLCPPLPLPPTIYFLYYTMNSQSMT